MIEQCEKCKHKEILKGGIVSCLYMGADCRKGEMFGPITNAERIRAMSDEELAVFLADEIPHGDCYDCDLDCANIDRGDFDNSCQRAFYEWLKQPAEKGEEK